MDDLAHDTRARWNDLAAAGVPYSRPWLDLDAHSARARLDPRGRLGDLRGRRVLCLAAGGGQQSAAFALLGAQVTVFDLSDEMLARDQAAARHYHTTVTTIQGDARDLSRFPDDAFDLVWQGHSLSFIPQLDPLFDGVARVLQTGGVYFLSSWNPLAYGADERWTGTGYLLAPGYVEGAESIPDDPRWTIATDDGKTVRVRGPREFRHTLAGIVNGVVARGFVITALEEDPLGRPDATPGSWDHFCTIAPPWLHLWMVKQPELLAPAQAQAGKLRDSAGGQK